GAGRRRPADLSLAARSQAAHAGLGRGECAAQAWRHRPRLHERRAPARTDAGPECHRAGTGAEVLRQLTGRLQRPQHQSGVDSVAPRPALPGAGETVRHHLQTRDCRIRGAGFRRVVTLKRRVMPAAPIAGCRDERPVSPAATYHRLQPARLHRINDMAYVLVQVTVSLTASITASNFTI